MSFADLERGLGERAPLARDTSIDPETDLEFSKLSRPVTLSIIKINSNVGAINKFVDLLGTSRDGPDLRNKLHNLTDVTREIVKNSTPDLKRLVSLDIPSTERHHKQSLSKTSTDYQHAIQSFQQAQTRSAERQRLFVERAKTNVGNGDLGGVVEPLGLNGVVAGKGKARDAEGPLLELDDRQQQMQLQQQQEVSDGDIEFQEQLIQEREGEIEQIEQGILELNQIFKDIGTLVGEQQTFVDEIQTNVYNTTRDTQNAAEQLTQAHESQKKAGRRMFYLLLVCLLVLTIIILAVLS